MQNLFKIDNCLVIVLIILYIASCENWLNMLPRVFIFHEYKNRASFTNCLDHLTVNTMDTYPYEYALPLTNCKLLTTI